MNPPRQPSLVDVARLADVAPTTVSRVVNDAASVSPSTRERVLAAIETSGYRPNRAARTLAGGRSHAIGVLCLEVGFHGPESMIRAIEASASADGYTVSLVSLRSSGTDDLRRGIDQLADLRVDGVIVISPFEATMAQLSAGISPWPSVVVSGSDAAAATVRIDQQFGAELAVEHLLERGHRTVHHVGGPESWIDASQQRARWETTLTRHQRAIPTPLTGDWGHGSGYAAVRTLATDPDVSAIFAANDQMALGILLALHEAGRRVPEDVSVVGFDDIEGAACYHPPLTSIRQDFAAVGTNAIDVLKRRLAGDPGEHVTLQPTLIVRASTGLPPTKDST